MALGTLERQAPPFFRQGPSPRSQLILYAALALFLMVADARWQVAVPVRQVVGTVLYPLQWLADQPARWLGRGGDYLESRQTAQREADALRIQLAEAALRAQQTELLQLENTRLRELLELRQQLDIPMRAAQVVHDVPDPYTRRVVVDQGQLAGVTRGAPVLDGVGVLGQVTQVYPFSSEVTLLTDRELSIPVLNVRTGVRGVAYGDPTLATAQGGGMELRFMLASADIEVGDLLTTSGIDGVYPPGLPVARVVAVDRRSDSSFVRIDCVPVARVAGVRHVLLLKPQEPNLEKKPVGSTVDAPKKGAKK